jgi:hypothetical protein
LKIKVNFFSKLLTTIVLIFLVVTTFFYFNNIQSTNPVLLANDPARDTLITSLIYSGQTDTPPAPMCGGCQKYPFIKNSNIIYYFFSFLIKKDPVNEILFICSIFSVSFIVFVYLFVKNISENVYTALFASLITAISPLFYKNIAPTMMPYQPLYIPSLSALFLWVASVNIKKKSVFLFFLSSLILFLGIQLHLSFLVFIPFFLLYSFLVCKNSCNKKKIAFIVIDLGVLLLLCKFNLNLYSLKNLYVNNTLTGGFSVNKVINYFTEDMWSLIEFDNKLVLLLMMICPFFLPIYRKKYSYLAIFFLLYLFPSGFPIYNYYSTPFWPIFILLISSTIIFNKNLYWFLLCFIIVFLGNSYKFKSIDFSLHSPAKESIDKMAEISDKIDSIKKNDDVLVYSSDYYFEVNSLFKGYYLYKYINNEFPKNINLNLFNSLVYAEDQDGLIYCINDTLPCEQYYNLYKNKGFLLKEVGKNDDKGVFFEFTPKLTLDKKTLNK